LNDRLQFPQTYGFQRSAHSFDHIWINVIFHSSLFLTRGLVLVFMPVSSLYLNISRKSVQITFMGDEQPAELSLSSGEGGSAKGDDDRKQGRKGDSDQEKENGDNPPGKQDSSASGEDDDDPIPEVGAEPPESPTKPDSAPASPASPAPDAAVADAGASKCCFLL
jgi:hypothetical protein